MLSEANIQRLEREGRHLEAARTGDPDLGPFQLLPGTWINAMAFAVLVLVLAVRPQGLVGKAYYASRVEV